MDGTRLVIRDILCREDLSRKYVFENVDGNFLKNEPQAIEMEEMCHGDDE